ncbi:transposase family protein [Nostoc punctiforme]|uniref:transposase family protein n=1 Tax=Nostoc punctiforme TaxID=272131 RepID=UPI003CC8A7B5
MACHHCNSYTDTVHQSRTKLVRDLSIFGRLVYLKVPRRQFYCGECKKFPTESLTKAKSSPKANK